MKQRMLPTIGPIAAVRAVFRRYGNPWDRIDANIDLIWWLVVAVVALTVVNVAIRMWQ